MSNPHHQPARHTTKEYRQSRVIRLHLDAIESAILRSKPLDARELYALLCNEVELLGRDLGVVE
ncbi:hypothetical protein LCGC14_1109420 [marine sediment metagenome]|uniref:Uncharacterized protein n=1 Tax=marine sediment metagenome TaxID=412755 RepID=A0A0F9PQE1_9ZZZZ